VTAEVLLDDIAEQSTRCYLVTEVLNMWEVSMAGSHNRNRLWKCKFFVVFKAVNKPHTFESVIRAEITRP
jgi:hypothetical protein